MEQVRQQAAQMGFGGTAIMDVQPARGIIRLKLGLTQPAQTGPFTIRYANIIATLLGAMNVQTKLYQEEDQ
jgi:hypothetical protein